MAQFQLLRCSVAIGGDTDHTLVRDRSRPILMPELMVLEFLHGEGAITDVHVVGTCDMSNDEALERLRIIYGPEAVKSVYPGTRPRLPTSDNTIPLCSKPVFVPKPTLPDNPDPKLRPLDQYTVPPVAKVDEMRGFDHPEPYREEEPDELEQDLFAPDLPRVADLPPTRVSFKGQARQARQTPSTLPDVADRPRRPGEADHDRAKG